MDTLDISTVVGHLIKGYVTLPDYSVLMEEIKIHDDDFVVLKDDRFPELDGVEYKILFTTVDAVIVQEVAMSKFSEVRMRFEVRKIDAGEWGNYFVEWITPSREFQYATAEEDRYLMCWNAWENGARWY
jgi:hypothetical protein